MTSPDKSSHNPSESHTKPFRGHPYAPFLSLLEVNNAIPLSPGHTLATPAHLVHKIEQRGEVLHVLPLASIRTEYDLITARDAVEQELLHQDLSSHASLLELEARKGRRSELTDIYLTEGKSYSSVTTYVIGMAEQVVTLIQAQGLDESDYTRLVDNIARAKKSLELFTLGISRFN